MATELSPTVMSRVDRSGPAVALPAAESSWRGFVRRFLALLLGLLAFIGALNYLVNPEDIYAPHLMPPVTCNVRAQKADLLSKAQPKPEALMFGSSRLMTIEPQQVERLTGLRTFNVSVSAAYTEDYYVLLRYAVERAQVEPKLVIIGVDVEAFHDHEPRNAYLLQPNALGGYLLKGEARGEGWRRFTTLFTIYQTRLSFASLWSRLGGKRTSTVEFTADGALKEDPWQKQIREGKFDRAKGLQAMIAQYVARWKSYTALDRDRMDYLAATLRYARAHGARVVVIATPMHPELRKALDPYGYEQRQEQMHAAVAKLAQAEGAQFVDVSDPASYGGLPEHFYDGVHEDSYNAERMIEAALGKHAVQ
jgi:hypothetical protein